MPLPLFTAPRATSTPVLDRGRRSVVAPLVAALILGSAGFGLVPPAAEAAPPELRTSFEPGDAPVSVSTPYGPQTNVSGFIPPGSLSADVSGITASAENPPGEAAVKLLDNNPGTKWLARERTATLTVTFTKPVVATEYAMTSGDDAPERDPKDWTVQGSDDGSTWTTIDDQRGQSFSGRRQLVRYPTGNRTAYRSYRLQITANAGSDLTQLADWDLRDARSTASPMLTSIAGGPSNGPNAKPGAGFTGAHALRYGGSHVSDGAASATNLLLTGVGQRLTRTSELSYLLFPDRTKDLKVPSSWVAVDLVLGDGSTMSSRTELVDANGFGVSALAHGQQKALFENEWNSIHIDLGSLAGHTVDKVLLRYEYPDGSAGSTFSGWLDDLRIGTAAPAVDASSRTNYVDTRRGTASSSSFSRGMNIPATAWPNGFNFFTPMTDGGSQGTLYEYARANNQDNLPTLQAIGISHEPSIWMGDRNQLGIMPSTSASPSGDLKDRQLAFRHADEIARPELYRVRFTNDLVTEVTPTDHGGMYRFTFPGKTGSVIVDRVGGSSSLRVAADGKVSGWVDGGNGAGISRMFVAGAFDTRPSATGDASGGRKDARYASFVTTPGQTVQLQLATSFISLDQAQHNLDLEVSGRRFDDVRREAQAAWNARLGVIDVTGATQNQLVTLYSNLYRLNLYPNSQFENTGTAAAPAYKHASPVAKPTGEATDTQTGAKVVDGKIYVNNGFWDTYRTVWPLYSLLYPKLAAELVDGFVQQYREGGWIARWSSPGYANIMTGTSSDASFAGAYLDGALPTANALEAYDAALKNATVVPPDANVGRKGLQRSIFLGYTPDSEHESVSWGLEGFINDHAIGLMAQKLAQDPRTPKARRARLAEESAYFLDRGQNYVRMFDRKTGFFRPKTENGQFAGGDNYDPTAWWGPYTETNGWNFAFHAPFDIAGLSSLHGGTDGLIKKLDTFFATPETGGGGNIHEMVESRAVRLGQLGQSNQVSHHIPYLYAAAGAPAKTQALVREIQQRLYVGSEIGQGYLGDEDNGEMSAWSIFSALGFYPLSVGSGQYVAGSPLFRRAVVHLENGRDLVVDAPDNSGANRYVRNVELNGQRLRTAELPQAALARGGRLTFAMSPTPTDWGARTAPKPVAPTPPADVSGDGVISVSDGTAPAALVDDDSRKTVTFTTARPSITWKSNGTARTVGSYTVTAAQDRVAPTAWHLEGSTNGKQWRRLDARVAQTFPWGTQTRPFQIASPGRYTSYRLTFDSSTGGAPPTVAEIELLTVPGASSRLTVTPASTATGRVGTEIDATLATISGGRGASEADYRATVDFLDGRGPQPATLTSTPTGDRRVSAAHTFDETGEHPVLVSATDGRTTVTTTATVSVTRDETLSGAFDTTCIGDAGTGANCDARGWAFDRSLLAASGFAQGKTVQVPGTNLTFDLPAADGGPDSATGVGQVIHLDLGTGATKLSIIGTATQATQREQGLLTFDDGTTAPLPIEFGDWVGAAAQPVSGGVVVGRSAGRLQGTSGGDGQTAAIFATAPFDLPAGKKVVSLTLPMESGDAGSVGRIHVFAVASDGDRSAATPLVAKSLTVGSQRAGTAFTADLAVVSGGQPATPGAYAARVNWGDGSPLADATVDPDSGTVTVAGRHTYAAAGDYLVLVTVDDGVRSTTVSTQVRVR